MGFGTSTIDFRTKNMGFATWTMGWDTVIMGLRNKIISTDFLGNDLWTSSMEKISFDNTGKKPKNMGF